jgi:Tol biopolymer transport system component
MLYAAECGGGCGSAGDPFHGIRVLDVTTGEDRLILPGEGFASVDWSPDGSRIAYAAWSRYEDGSFTPDGGLYVMSADGGEPTQLPTTAPVESVDWSPDGTTLVYSDRHVEMYAITADGSGRVSLGPGVGPHWSPDGMRIAFSVTDGPCQIWTMAPDGTDRRILATFPTADTETCSGSFRPGPVWSPDGRQLAMLVSRELWIVNADGSDPHVLPLGGFIHRVGPPHGIAWRPVP